MAAALLCGCAKPEKAVQLKFQAGHLEWWTDDELRTFGKTNLSLLVFAPDGLMETNVESLDEAADILGQYGWEFTGAQFKGNHEIYYMRRQATNDCKFSLLPP